MSQPPEKSVNTKQVEGGSDTKTTAIDRLIKVLERLAEKNQ